MATERHLQSTAQRHAMDRCDDRFGARLDRVDQSRQPWFDWWLAEFGDVGTARKYLAGPPNDDRPDRGIGLCLGDGLAEPLTDTRAQRVDRRVVHHDLENVVVQPGLDHGAVSRQNEVSPMRRGRAKGWEEERPASTTRAWPLT